MKSIANDLGPLLRGVKINPLPPFNPSCCSIRCAVHYVLVPVVTHAPGCSSAPDGVFVMTGTTTADTKVSSTEEAPIADN